MTDMVNPADIPRVSNPLQVTSATFTLDETYWGYIIKSCAAPNTGMKIAQTASLFIGAALLAAALGLWLIPQSMLSTDAFIMRLGASVIFTGSAVLLLWFSSRGTHSEIQIDNSLGEVREVVRNQAGKTTLLGRYGFDSIGGVFLDRQPGESDGTLVLRYRNTAQILPVVTGGKADLEVLKDRLGRDLMVGALQSQLDDAFAEVAA